ncbi:hypothetical protein BDY21DRAFT_145620 [Lineolata rhizophorae]|uniref:C2H2-type domain-containing protein n=1 Tax=Lineolata rhizophorae TaxID=578093 RepID=A0A6A6NMV5_9PEZI|nr:hypothetical protein BDY21DRAFT_145620 [Lineolata rhizophorae]
MACWLLQATVHSVLRMYQFLNRSYWLDHIRKHGSQPVGCPHPHCGSAEFGSAQQLRFHLHGAHGIRGLERTTPSKRSRGSEEKSPRRKRQRSLKKEEQDEVSIEMDYYFVNFTSEGLGSCERRKVKSPHSPADEKVPETGLLSPPSPGAEPIDPAIFQEAPDAITKAPETIPLENSLQEHQGFPPFPSPSTENEAPIPRETPPSSICDEDLIDPAILQSNVSPSDVVPAGLLQSAYTHGTVACAKLTERV